MGTTPRPSPQADGLPPLHSLDDALRCAGVIATVQQSATVYVEQGRGSRMQYHVRHQGDAPPARYGVVYQVSRMMVPVVAS